MAKLGIDAYGGDNGLKANLDAVIKYVKNFDDDIYIYGNEKDIKEYLDSKSEVGNKHIYIINATEKIEMDEHPVFALRNKKNSSLVLATNDLINNKTDVLISAGSTGALVALAQLYIKPLDKIKRPVVASIVPTMKNPCLIIDSGSNMDAESEWIYQYALIGSAYMSCLYGTDKVKVGLLNVGVEETKGNKITLEAYKLLNENKDKINFIGNIEAREVSTGVCDVLCCDGFAGNVILKMYEGTARNLFKIIKQALNANIITKIGALMIKKSLKNVLKQYNSDKYGGAPILGAKKLIIKCHGNSKDEEIYNAMIQAKTLVDKNIINIINDKLEAKNGI